MVWIFARLKLRLVANGFRLGWQQKMGLVLGVVYAVPLAVGGFVLLALTRSNPELARPTTIGVFFLLFLGWLVGPLLGFGSDETLDPARLALLPWPAGSWRPGSSRPRRWASVPPPPPSWSPAPSSAWPRPVPGRWWSWPPWSWSSPCASWGPGP